MSKKLLVMTAVAIMLGGALIALPSATAQGGGIPAPNLAAPTVSGLPNAPLAPLVTQQFKVASSLDFSQPLQPLGGVEGAVTVRTDINCPGGVTVTGQESQVLNTVSTTGTTQEFPFESQFFLTISRDIRALDPQQCTVTVSATPAGTSIPPPAAQTSTFSVQADYFGLIEAKTDVKLKQGAPQKQVPFNMEVTNFGNGQTKVTFETIEKPGGKWQGLVPDQLLLDEAGGNRQSATSVYTVVTPFKNGWNNEEGGFTIRISPEYAFNPDKQGGEVIVNLVARVRGVYVPTLEPMIMVGAVIGTGLVARMLRED